MIKIKNWSSYQSYKDRKPPWIRFHKSMLDNFEFHAMSADARALLPMLWLLASEDKDPVSGLIRDSYEKITFRLRTNIKVFTKTLKEIESSGFVSLQVIDNVECNETVTKPLHDRNETVTTETETETETEKGCDYWKENRLTDEYKAFKKMRQQTRKPINDVAASRLIAKHKKLVGEGNDPAEIINLATERCWASFFPTKRETKKMVPSNIADIQKLVEKENIDLPANCSPFDARKIIAQATGMAL